ncbi:MAG: 50S ribosomal protein L25 [bacterium]|nr:50S ribosomal protein L25 [bacterium]
MEKIKIQATKRDILGKQVSSLRREGLIPVVLYGKGKDNMSLSVNKKDFDRAYKMSGGSTIIQVEIDGEKTKNVLIKDIDKSPVSDSILHADFYQVRMSEKITAPIPLSFVGDSKAVIDLGGSLITNKSEVEVECLPGDLPHEIEVDISVLEDFEAVIHLKDIKMPEGVEIKDDIEETIALVEPPRSEEELAELEEPVEAGEMPEAEKGQAEEGETEGSEEAKSSEAPEAKKE